MSLRGVAHFLIVLLAASPHWSLASTGHHKRHVRAEYASAVVSPTGEIIVAKQVPEAPAAVPAAPPAAPATPAAPEMAPPVVPAAPLAAPATPAAPEMSTPVVPPGKTFIQQTNGSTPTGWMQLGSPRKWLMVIFDTGSDKLVAKTWDTILAELAMVDQGISHMVLPSEKLYNHETSTSYVAQSIFDNRTQLWQHAKSEIMYGSGLAITDEGNDTVQIGHDAKSFVLENFSISEITQDSLALLHSGKGVAGILGLQHMKNRSLGTSIFSRMRDEGLFSSFGYCRGTGNNGTFIWGDQSTEGDAIPVIGQMHWAVSVAMWKVEGAVKKPSDATAIKDGMVVLAEEPALHSSIVRRAWPGDSDTDADVFGDDQMVNPDGEPDPFGPDQMGGGPPDPFGPDQMGGGPAARMQEAQMREAREAARQYKRYSSGEEVPCADGKCCGILDSGSNIIAGPTAVMKFLSEQIGLKEDCSNYDTLPRISLSFGGKNVTIQKEGYVIKVPLPSFSMGGGGAMHGDGGMGGNGPLSLKASSGIKGAASQLEQEARHESGSHLTWHSVLADLRDTRGIDLTMHLRQPPVAVSSDHAHKNISAPEFMCLPALVPIDKHTEHGPLFIVGTPLLQTNYARWSFAPGTDAPQVFIQKLEECETCKQAAASFQENAAVAGTSTAANPGASSANTPAAGDPTAASQPTPTAVVNPAAGTKTAVVGTGHVNPADPAATHAGDVINANLAAALEETSIPVGMPRGMSRGSVPQIVELDEIRFPHWALQIETV